MDTSTPPTTKGLSASRLRLFKLIMFGMLIGLLLLAVVGAEWAARSYERSRAVPPDYFPQIYYPHRRLRYGLVPNLDYYGWFRINSLGFRGREFNVEKTPGRLRVICLGGSTTFDIGSIGKALPWPEVLEEQLRKKLGAQEIEVLNLGIPGSNSLDSLVDLQMRVLRLKPDLLIVYQGHNDFVYSFPAAADPDLYPQEAPPKSALKRWLKQRSVLYSKAEGKIGSRLSGLLGIGGASEKNDPALVDRSIERGLADFSDNLRSIAAVARANRIPLVLPQVVLPLQEAGGAECDLCARLPPLFGNLVAEKISAMFGRYDAVLRDVAAEGPGVHHVRTNGFVPNEERYYHDAIHFAPEGSRLMGEKLADALLPILAPPSAAAIPTGAAQ